jgi:hypothetical protein
MTQKALGSAILFTIGIRPAPASPERTDHTATPAHTTTPKRLTIVALKWMPNNVIHSSRRGNLEHDVPDRRPQAVTRPNVFHGSNTVASLTPETCRSPPPRHPAGKQTFGRAPEGGFCPLTQDE